MNFIKDNNHLQDLLKEEDALVLYFSDGTCGVGEALGPKVDAMLKEKFPKFKLYALAQGIHQEIFAHYQIFTIPSLLLLIDGKEYIRKARNFGVLELEKEFERLYTLVFEE
jgi:thioredoxin-like negative regulator of GroEL